MGRIGLGSGSHWVGEWIARSEREIDMHRKKKKTKQDLMPFYPVQSWRPVWPVFFWESHLEGGG